MAAHLGASGRDLVSLGSTERRSLDLGTLRADLASLWQDEGRGVVKACHATLILSVSGSEKTEPLLDDLVRDRPSRVLLLSPEASLKPGEVDAWATGSCFREPELESLICTETVHLRFGTASDARVTSVVRSLAVGGMPVEILVLSGSPFHQAWIESLGSEVDRVLFRSDELSASERVSLWERCIRRDELPGYEDVRWVALQGWRWVVASSFDGGRTRLLSQIRRVRLGAGVPLEHAADAILFAGWLGSRLGWEQPQRVSESRWSLRAPEGGEISLEIETPPEADRDGGLCAVEFQDASGSVVHSWRWSLAGRAWHLRPAGDGPPRVVRGIPETASTPWLRALGRRRASAVACEAMTLAHRLEAR